MSRVTKDGLSSYTSGIAYIEDVKRLPGRAQEGKKPRSFVVVKMAMHSGRQSDGKLAYIYPECGITDELKEVIDELQQRLSADPKPKLVMSVQIANLRGKPWFDGGKSGVNYRGTLIGLAPMEEDDDDAA